MASFLGIGLGILLGRNGRRLLARRRSRCCCSVVVLLIYQAQLNVQVKSPDELFFGLAESTRGGHQLPRPAASWSLLVTGLMAALAMPLGPLLKSDAAAARPTPSTSWARWPASRPSPLLSAAGHDPARLVRRRGRPAAPAWPWARASRPARPGQRRGAGRHALASSWPTWPRGRHLVAVLPDHDVHRPATARWTSTSTASPTRRSTRVDGAAGAVLRRRSTSGSPARRTRTC